MGSIELKGGKIKYEYAFDANDKIVAIDQVDPLNRCKYKCISCGNKLVAALGEKRQKHFRHAVIKPCSPESYLHYMGKHLFYETYQSCLKESKNYEIEINSPRVCNRCELINCKVGNECLKYNLTDYFKKIYKEKHDESFIPDLLLKDKYGESVYIELAVTHKSSPKKIVLGKRIIEIVIEKEDDLKLLTSCALTYKDSRVKFINFNPVPITGDFFKECSNKVSFFILNKDGIANIKENEFWYTYENNAKDKESNCKIIQNNRNCAYIQELEKAYLNGLKVKNCFLCQHHNKQTINQIEKNFYMTVFCKHKKKSCDSNDAVKCSSYRPDRIVFQSV